MKSQISRLMIKRRIGQPAYDHVGQMSVDGPHRRRLYYTLPMRIKRAKKQNERWVLKQIGAAHRKKLLWRDPIMLSIPLRNAVERLVMQDVIAYRERKVLGGWALVKVDSRRYR